MNKAISKAGANVAPTLIYVAVGFGIYWLFKSELKKLWEEFTGKPKATVTEVTTPEGSSAKIEARITKPTGTVDQRGRAETNFLDTLYYAQAEITNFGPSRRATISFESKEAASWRAFSEGTNVVNKSVDLPSGRRVLIDFEVGIGAAPVRLGRINCDGVLKVDGQQVAWSYFVV